MEKRVNFYEGMDVDPQDHINLQTYAQEGLDHVVADAITIAQRYAGFLVTKSAATSVSVTSGRLYSGGKRYAKDIPTTQDFITSLPLAGKKIVSVVVSGNEIDTGETPREFLINEETGASEPKSVAMTKVRIASVLFSQGAESPDPTPPIIDPGYTRIANITLSTTGVDKVEMVIDNSVENLDKIGDRADALEMFQNTAGPKIQTLGTDLAKLAGQLAASVSGGIVGRMLERLAVIEAKDKIPTNAVDSKADYFLDKFGVDLTHPLSNAKISEGIRFPDFASSKTQLQIFDPLNPNQVTKADGWMFPAYDRELWLSNTRYLSETQIAGFSYQANEMVQKTGARTRIRYGTEYTVCSNSAFFGTGVYDYKTNTLRRPDDTLWQVTQLYAADANGIVLTGAPNAYLNYDAAGNGIEHSAVRLTQIFYDTTFEDYWDNVTIDHTVNGAQIAETFLQGQDIWLDAIGLFFTKLAATGSLTISVCEVTKFGTPNLEALVMHTTLDRASMKAYPAETVVPIPPTFLRAGKRYALLLTTAADHWVAMTPGEDFKQGTFFYVLDGAYAQGDGTKDLMFKMYKAKFRSNRAVIALSPITLAGGILSIDINADSIVPGATQLTYEIQPAGSGSWFNLIDTDSYMLGRDGSIPVTCGLRAVFAGTVDMMPAVRLSGSLCSVSRPDTTRTSIAKIRTLPAASTSIHVLERYENWDPVHHTATVKLRTGAGYNTVTSPTMVIDSPVTTDEFGQKVLERHYVFTFGTAITTYQVQHQATTDTPKIVFHVANRKDYSL